MNLRSTTGKQTNEEPTSDVRLLDTLLGEPFGENVGHGLGREGNLEWELLLVLGHREYTLFIETSAREYEKE